jgi:hypothetical protein
MPYLLGTRNLMRAASSSFALVSTSLDVHEQPGGAYENGWGRGPLASWWHTGSFLTPGMTASAELCRVLKIKGCVETRTLASSSVEAPVVFSRVRQYLLARWRQS